MCPKDTKLVHIGDRECDFINFITQSIDNGFSLVVRANSDRNLDDEDASGYEKIDWYKLRWLIEVFHKIMKSGCKVEERYLEEVERLERGLALFSIIANRLLFMTYISRVAPEAPRSDVFEKHEWQTLYCLNFCTAKMPDHTPTIREAIVWMAKLGGFLGRKRDGEPGPIVLWRGLQAMSNGAEVFKICNPGLS